MTTADGQPGPIGSTAAVEVEWHLREVALAIRDASALVSPELLRIVLAGLAEAVRRIVARQGEAPAPPPILFRDHIVRGRLHVGAADQGGDPHSGRPATGPSRQASRHEHRSGAAMRRLGVAALLPWAVGPARISMGCRPGWSASASAARRGAAPGDSPHRRRAAPSTSSTLKGRRLRGVLCVQQASALVTHAEDHDLAGRPAAPGGVSDGSAVGRACPEGGRSPPSGGLHGRGRGWHDEARQPTYLRSGEVAKLLHAATSTIAGGPGTASSQPSALSPVATATPPPRSSASLASSGADSAMRQCVPARSPGRATSTRGRSLGGPAPARSRPCARWAAAGFSTRPSGPRGRLCPRREEARAAPWGAKRVAGPRKRPSVNVPAEQEHFERLDRHNNALEPPSGR